MSDSLRDALEKLVDDYEYIPSFMLAELLNGDGVNSDLSTCPGCGVKVIGHETCGDPTRPQCAGK